VPVWSVQTEKGMCVSYNTRDGWRAVGEDVELPARFEMTRPALRGTPEVYMGFEVIDGVPLCFEVRFRSGKGGRGVRASDLRFETIDDWIAHCSGLVARHVRKKHTDDRPLAVRTERDADFGKVVGVVARVRRGARRSVTDALLREVADTYRANIGRAPTASVSEAFDVSYRTAGDYVRQARDRRYLGESIKQGKAGER
jgi:hypothetical protein